MTGNSEGKGSAQCASNTILNMQINAKVDLEEVHICDLYDASGARRCGRCARANRKDASKGTSAAQCTAATCSLEHWSADLCQFYSDDIGTPRAMYSVK